MNIVEKIELLLTVVSNTERNLFDRMYPNGVTSIDNKKNAFRQVEQTLLQRTERIEKLRLENKQLKSQIEELKLRHKEEIKELTSKFEDKLGVKEESSSNTEECDNCQLLDALQAAGVDNWDGYENAIEIMEEWNNS